MDYDRGKYHNLEFEQDRNDRHGQTLTDLLGELK